METTVISFRGHKNLRGWVQYAGGSFGSAGVLLTMIITRAAHGQATESRADRWIDGILYRKREPVGIGDTRVYAVRLPESTAQLARKCAIAREKSISEWCSVVLSDWQETFYEYKEKYGAIGKPWLSQYAEDYRAMAADIANVYAEKHHETGVGT